MVKGGGVWVTVMTRLLPNPWHKEAETAEKSALQKRRMVIDEEDGCYIPIQTPDSKSYKLVPKGELKPEQFPKAVVEALRREGLRFWYVLKGGSCYGAYFRMQQMVRPNGMGLGFTSKCTPTPAAIQGWMQIPLPPIVCWSIPAKKTDNCLCDLFLAPRSSKDDTQTAVKTLRAKSVTLLARGWIDSEFSMKHLQEALEWLNESRRLSTTGDLDVESVSVLRERYLGNAVVVKEAQDLMSAMISANVRTPRMAFVSLLSTYVSKGQMDSAETLVEQMLEQRRPPYHLVVSSFAEMRCASEAEGCLSKILGEVVEAKLWMMYHSRLAPMERTVLAVINSYAQSLRPFAAEATLQRFEKRNVELGLAAHGAITEAFLMADQVDMAKELYPSTWLKAIRAVPHHASAQIMTLRDGKHQALIISVEEQDISARLSPDEVQLHRLILLVALPLWAMRHALWPAVGLLSGWRWLAQRDLLPVARCTSGCRSMSNLTKLPSSQEYNEGGLSDEIRLTFRRVRLRDIGGTMAQELQDLEAKDVDLAVLPDGHLVASQADQVLWQLRPPPALRVLYTSGICSKDNYLSLLQRFGGDRGDSAFVVLVEVFEDVVSPEFWHGLGKQLPLICDFQIWVFAEKLPLITVVASDLPQERKTGLTSVLMKNDASGHDRIVMRPSATSRKELLVELRKGRQPLATAKKLLQLPYAPAKDLSVALGVLGQQQQWLDAIHLLQSLGGNLRPDIFCVNACAGAAMRGSAWRWTVEVLQRGKSEMTLDPSSLNLVCSAYEKTSMWRCALHRLAQSADFGRAEVLAYNAAASACSSSKWRLSTSMMQVMAQQCIQTTIVSFTAAVAAPDVLPWFLAASMLSQLKQRRLQADTAMVNAAMAVAGWRTALDIGEAFRDEGLPLNLLGQNTIIHQLSSSWQMASLKLEKLQSGELGPPDVISFNSSIAAHESGGQWILAAVVLDKLMTSTKPSSISFNSMTSTAASSQEWQTALRLQQGSLRKLHADKDPISFATVLGACQHALKWSMASFFLRKAMQARIATTSSGHNAALMACSQRWLEAIKMLKELRGIRSDEITFAAAAGACQEAGQWEYVLALRSVSLSGGAPPALLLQNAIHSAWRRARQWQGSVQLLREMQELQPRYLKEDDILPDVVSFAATVQTCELGAEPGPAVMVLDRCSSRSWLRPL
eukprot:symbB.v1.2.008202.t1/scaffold492.1/size196413/5